MNTRDIQVIRKVCELGTLSKAAGELYMTPQAVSVTIKKIENELGVELFKRASGGMLMTTNGRLFYEKSEELVSKLNDLDSMFHLDIHNQHGTICIVSALGIMAEIGVDTLWKFNDVYPNFRFEVIEGTDLKVEQLVKDGTADIGFAIEPVNRDEFDVQPWCEFDCCVMMSKNTALYEKVKDQDYITVEDLDGVPLVMENKAFKVHRIFDRMCEQAGIVPNIYYETVEIDFAHSIAATGRAACVTVSAVAMDSQYQDLFMIPFKDTLMWNWCFIRKKDKVMTPIENEMINYFTQYTNGSL